MLHLLLIIISSHLSLSSVFFVHNYVQKVEIKMALVKTPHESLMIAHRVVQPLQTHIIYTYLIFVRTVLCALANEPSDIQWNSNLSHSIARISSIYCDQSVHLGEGNLD